MSIHGFVDQNGQIQKYDYTDLENKPTIPAEVLIDGTLTEEGQAADAKAVGDALQNIGGGFSAMAKQALLNIFQQVAYIGDDGQDYYDALEAALFPGSVYTITNTLSNCTTTNNATAIMDGDVYNATIIPSSGYTLDGATVTITMGGQTVTGFYNNGQISIPNVTGDLVITVTATSSVASISAVFTQGSAAIYDIDTLDTLKQYLTVTATYSDSTTATVTDYALSGTLTEGTSTITASYGGKTDTFSVTVSHKDNLLYHIENRVFDGTEGDGVATGVNIQAVNAAFTILAQLTTTSTMGGLSNKFTVFSSRDNPPSIQFNEYSVNAAHSNFRYMGQYSDNNFDMRSAGIYKIAVVHANGANNATCYMKANSGTVLTKTLTDNTFTTDSSAEVVFGARSSSNWYLKGTLNLGEIYNKEFSAAEIDAFMGA